MHGRHRLRLAFSSFMGAAEKIFLTSACSCLGVMLAINVVNLIARNIWGTGINWVWPWSGVLMIWTVFLSFFVLYRRKLDIVVEYFTAKFSGRWQQAARALYNLCTAAVCSSIVLEANQIIDRQVGVIEFVGIERYGLSLPLIASCSFIVIDQLGELIGLKVANSSEEEELPRWSL